MRIEREQRRGCEDCGSAGETFLLTAGGKWLRLCHRCWEGVNSLRFQVVACNLQSAEKR